MITVEEAFAPLEINRVVDNAIEDVWHPISPVPSDAPGLTNEILRRFSPRGYEVTGGWRYLDSKRRLLVSPFVLIEPRAIW
jgi:hypothetical protein